MLLSICYLSCLSKLFSWQGHSRFLPYFSSLLFVCWLKFADCAQKYHELLVHSELLTWLCQICTWTCCLFSTFDLHPCDSVVSDTFLSEDNRFLSLTSMHAIWNVCTISQTCPEYSGTAAVIILSRMKWSWLRLWWRLYFSQFDDKDF